MQTEHNYFLWPHNMYSICNLSRCFRCTILGIWMHSGYFITVFGLKFSFKVSEAALDCIFIKKLLVSAVCSNFLWILLFGLQDFGFREYRRVGQKHGGRYGEVVATWLASQFTWSTRIIFILLWIVSKFVPIFHSRPQCFISLITFTTF